VACAVEIVLNVTSTIRKKSLIAALFGGEDTDGNIALYMVFGEFTVILIFAWQKLT
jgi:hypothetical protein